MFDCRLVGKNKRVIKRGEKKKKKKRRRRSRSLNSIIVLNGLGLQLLRVEKNCLKELLSFSGF